MDVPATPSNSPVLSLAVRVSLPFTDMSGVLQKWFARCNKAVVFQHDADEDISRTHVHMALIGLDCKTEALKRMWPDAPGKGNEFWSFTPLRDQGLYLTYMSKGELRPVLVKNISPAEIEERRQAWVEPVKAAAASDPLEHYISLVFAKFEHYSLSSYVEHYRHVRFQESDTIFHSNQDYESFLLSEVRSATMKVYWGVNRRVPHATQYKIVAGSAFLRICEKLGLDGFEVLKNLWY